MTLHSLKGYQQKNPRNDCTLAQFLVFPFLHFLSQYAECVCTALSLDETLSDSADLKWAFKHVEK